LTHGELVAVAVNWLRNSRGCGVVLSERGTHEIPDAIGWGKLTIVVEVKVTRADFLADLRKSHRNGPAAFGRERWYLTPKGLLACETIPAPWGLLEWNGRVCRRIVLPTVLPDCLESVEHERRLLLGELRAYHAQGITYKRGAARWNLPTDGTARAPLQGPQEVGLL
jgi:hypothetical protein